MFRAIFAAVVLLAILAATGSEAATPVYPPGLRIGLEPAPGLSLSRRFAGFEDADHHVTVRILGLPAAAYDQLTRSANAENQPGLSEVKRETFSFASGSGLLVRGEARKAAIRRWFLIAHAPATVAPNLTALVRVEVPDAARTVYSDAVVRRMLASVSFRHVPMQELLGLLPFKLTAMAGFRVIKVEPHGVIVTDGPGQDFAKQPYAVISIGRGAPDRRSDRGRFARDLLIRSPVPNLKLTLAQPMRINGRPGYEMRAEATGPSGGPITVVQWLQFGGISGGFLRMVAVFPKQDFDTVFNRFRALRDGVVFK